MIGKKLKFAWQRITRGYADSDLEDMAEWFGAVVPRMLRQMAEESDTHPYGKDRDEWKNTLRCMARQFENASHGEKSMLPNLNSIASFEEVERVEKMREECKNLGFEMLSKNFYDLWTYE